VRSKADEMASLIWRTARKRKIRKKLKQKPSSSEETVQAIIRECSPGGRSETTGVGFVKQVDFKPGVKELWMSTVVN